jgi:hypothetical protein
VGPTVRERERREEYIFFFFFQEKGILTHVTISRRAFFRTVVAGAKAVTIGERLGPALDSTDELGLCYQ